MAAGVAGGVGAGGLTSRMGIEKAHRHAYGDEEADMLTRTRTLLGTILPHVWVSCREGHPKEGAVRIFDQHAGLGPFSGVYAALLHAREQGLGAVLPLSCDLPFMDAPTLWRLLEARAAHRAEAKAQGTVPNLKTTYLQVETGFIESLTAIYEVAAIPLFEAALAQDERKLSRIIPAEQRTHIPYAHHEALPFFNLNYPADLEVFRRLLAAL